MQVETPHPTKKGFKRGIEEVIDLDDYSSHSSKKSKLYRNEKESEHLVESSSFDWFSITVGRSEMHTFISYSWRSWHTFIIILKESYEHIEEKNKKIKENVASHLEAQSVSEYHTKLLSTMYLEINKIKLSFSHPSALIVASAAGFKTVKLTVDEKYTPFPDKINVHKKTRELIYSDLSKTSLAASK